MDIIQNIKDYQLDTAVVTIGNFDGVHLGHQKVLQQVTEKAKKHHRTSVAITFINHPSEVLHPEKPVCYLCTPEHKTQLLEQQGLNVLVQLFFTKEFSLQTAEAFLETIQSSIPFSHLILGHNASFGRNKQGTPEAIQDLAEAYNFEVEYVPPFTFEGSNVSSSKIRNYVLQGDLVQVEKLLGRPYSIYSTVIPGKGVGRQMGFPTANLNVAGLCLPPFGVYSVKVKIDEHTYDGIANLGIAPTIRNDKKPILEFHLFEETVQDIKGHYVEVALHHFIRPEQKFSSLIELQNQIKTDIEQAKRSY